MPKKKNKVDKGKYGIYFVIPYFVVFLLFSLYPVIYTLIISLEKWDGMSLNPAFVGIKNYVTLIHDALFYQAIANTFIMWICAVIPQMVFALLLAVMFNSAKKIKGKEFFRAAMYLPNLITPAAVAVLFVFLFDWQTGAINKILLDLHVINKPFNWFLSEYFSRGIMSLISWWMWFGYSTIIFGAGLNNIPAELYESASIDGATPWQSFKSITIPMLKPTVLYAAITSLIGGMQTFDIPYVMTGGQGNPNNKTLTVVMYLYNTAFQNSNYGYGSAIGYGLFILILIFSIITFKFINRNVEND
ncbi:MULTISPECIES: sugar ABC transporter permease [unclassified Clostridium]|uniref:carbohydrate ABC transporter permease n=1 Tax=unclassified Clostridium TaxID=2614128 RepID=UPI00029777E1|nr:MULTISPECIES: sugar ABC transporter permease [unclassified Clostridium]EKQ50395.1 MAG: permease component of ABC-type sugar transporter [Clostridium sp. Maddingley MBC34-26]